MLSHQRFFGIGIAALLSLGILAAPSQASAQWYRYHSRTHSEDSARNNAIALGAAGLILMNSHQNTLGTIALAGAAVEAGVMQHDIDQRHSRYGYGHNDRYGYNGGYRRGDGDRDDRRGNDRYDDDRYYNNGYGNGYGYGRTNRDRDDRDRYDRDRNNRRGGDSWYRSVIRNGRNRRNDRDHDGD